jgi:DNA-binding transcriptional regulator YhcF (GntR family)
MPKEKNKRSKYPLKNPNRNNRGGHTTWDKLTWRDKINRKRELVKACLLKQAIPNLAAAARFAGVNHNTVSKIFYELKLTGQVASYEYNNVKSPEQTNVLVRDVSAIEGGFMTVVDLKRRHPSFSRKAILKHLHHQGFRYRLLPKNTLNPDRRTINSTRVCRVISHITQAMSFDDTTVLYIDEMKFPLFQTSSRRWQHPETPEDSAVIYNRREVDETCLVAIALCSQDKFEAVQLYQREINGYDFLYFLNTAIPQLPAGRHYTIIADNATWHTSDAVRRSKASEFLFFNEPGMFQLNLIENAFSFVRSEFRKRPIVETIEEEATNIMRIFFDSVNKRRFLGLVRNHLRQLDKYLTKYQQR